MMGAICMTCAQIHARGEPCPYCNTTRDSRREQRNLNKPHRIIYNTKRWKETRAKALARDHHACVECGSSLSLSVHHITPMQHGGAPFDLDNLTTLCSSCHGHIDANLTEGVERLHPDIEQMHTARRTRSSTAYINRTTRTKKRQAATTRSLKALDLRNQGATWQEIADQLGYAKPGSAYYAAHAAARATNGEARRTWTVA